MTILSTKFVPLRTEELIELTSTLAVECAAHVKKTGQIVLRRREKRIRGKILTNFNVPGVIIEK